MAITVRDLRIDFFRGLALLMIFIDHVPGNALSALTLQAFGTCDAAEVFVLLAGYSSGLAFAPIFQRASWPAATARVLIRCWDIYVAHIVLFCVVAGIVVSAVRHFDNPLYLEHVNLLPLFADTEGALVAVLTLHYLPNFLDILPLYVLLLALVPFALPLALRQPALVLLAAAALWGLVQVAPFNLPNYPGDAGWYFNPFAWQFLFVIGLVLGSLRHRGVRLDPRLCRLLVIASGPVVLVALLVAAPWRQIPGLEEVVIIPWSWLPPVSKTDLSVIRLVNILALFCLAGSLIRAEAPWLRGRIGGAVALLGTQPLPVFSVGIVASVLGAVVFFEAGRGLLAHVVVNLTGALAALAVAWIAAWLKSEPWRRPAAIADDGGAHPAPVAGLERR
ncbi:MAG: OpgC domain-containing protein [Rhodospirillales bacterium]|nr:OpgC domain-containing protein [Rhodospirillales bacterium]